MSIDDALLRDPRVILLARRLAVSRFDAIGRLLSVWSICYDRVATSLPAEQIDAAAECDGFAAHLVSVGLAASVSGGKGGGAGSVFRLMGVASRIEYLNRAKSSGREGGKKKAVNASASAKPYKGDSANPLGSSYPSVPDSVSASVSDPVSDPETLRSGQARPAVEPTAVEPLTLAPFPPPPAPKPRAQPSGDHARVIAAYVDRYEHATGAKPRITGRTGAEVKSLLASHGADEVIRRLDVLASGAGPEWLYRDGSPWDFGTLVSQFDKLAKAAAPVPRGPGGVPAPPPRAMATLSGAAPMNLPPPLPPLALPHGDHDHDQGGPLDR